jgi:predicted regulator of Ras-like GTPase activity (Roadblock/LC7/MglB family)
MLAGGLVVASMTPADADDDVQAVAATPHSLAQVVSAQNSPAPVLRGLAN